ncbi:hypothetical protein ACWGBH_19670 [Streptomyces massasporeus]
MTSLVVGAAGTGWLVVGAAGTGRLVLVALFALLGLAAPPSVSGLEKARARTAAAPA